MARQEKQAEHTYDELLAAIRRGDLASAYLFFGNEHFLIQNLVRLLEAQCLEPAVREVDGLTLQLNGRYANFDLNELNEQLRTPPFMSRKRFILVRDSALFASTQNLGANRQDDLETLLRTIPDSSCLVFWEEKADKRGKGYKLFNELAVTAELNHPDTATLSQWVQQSLRQRDLVIDHSTAQDLVSRCGSDMQLLTNEMTKLALYCAGSGTSAIDGPLLDRLAPPDMQGRIFDVTDALSQGDSATALILLQRMRQNKEPAQVILLMLGRNFRQLLCASRHDAAWLQAELKVPAFVARRLVGQARQWRPEVLGQLIDASWRTDMDIKRGRLDEETALEILLAQAGRAARYSKQTSRRS